jgi:hypothetical protein
MDLRTVIEGDAAMVVHQPQPHDEAQTLLVRAGG